MKIYRQYIGTGCTRSTVKILMVSTTILNPPLSTCVHLCPPASTCYFCPPMISIFQGIPWQWLGFSHSPRPHRPPPLLPDLSPPHPLPLGQAQGYHSHFSHHGHDRPPLILPCLPLPHPLPLGQTHGKPTLIVITKGRNTPEQSRSKINI